MAEAPWDWVDRSGARCPDGLPGLKEGRLPRSREGGCLLTFDRRLTSSGVSDPQAAKRDDDLGAFFNEKAGADSPRDGRV
jgi:hypothetical protein